MLRKFVNWWNKKTDEDMVEATEGFYTEEEEYKFETTLVRDLKIIADLLGKEFPEKLTSSFRALKMEGTIQFYTEKVDTYKVRETIGLKSLKIVRNWENIETCSWEADYKEYEKVYRSKHLRYANVVRELLDVVQKNFDNADYLYTFCKYEDSIYIVSSTLKDEYENNDRGISAEVFQKAKIIIEKFGQAFMKKYKELEHIEELQKEAVSKSLINRLDSEIEFIDKYIEVN